MTDTTITPQQAVLALINRGHTDEQVAVMLGEKLGATNPSAQAVRRWRSGRGSPARVYREALMRVYRDIFG